MIRAIPLKDARVEDELRTAPVRTIEEVSLLGGLGPECSRLAGVRTPIKATPHDAAVGDFVVSHSTSRASRNLTSNFFSASVMLQFICLMTRISASVKFI